MLDQAEQTGRADAKLYRSDPSAARTGALGAFTADSKPIALLLRRILLGIDVPPGMLAWARPLFRINDRLAQVDRFLERYAYWRGVKGGLSDGDLWRRFSRPPVILMYHAMADRREPPSCYVITKRRFLLQMLWLRLCRYRVISLSDLVEHIRGERLPPARSVIVTFDDGYADTYHLAFPVLRTLRIPATVFLVSRAIGGAANWTDEPATVGRPLMTADLVNELLAGGCEVGAHTRTHASLTDMPADASRELEIVGSRHDLEKDFGRPIRTFAYPFGDYDGDIADSVRRAGFHAACCSRSGANDPATPPFELRRVEVRGTDSLLRFPYMVWSGRRVRRTAARG